MSLNYVVLPQQSLFDVAVEVYGNVEAVNWLVEDNPQLPGPTGPVVAGQVLALRNGAMNARLAAILADYAPFQTVTSQDMPSGIGYWNLTDYILQ